MIDELTVSALLKNDKNTSCATSYTSSLLLIYLDIIKYTNLKSSDIVSINGSEYCNMILNGSSNKAKNGKVFLCSHGTLRSFGDRYGWDKVSKLFKEL